MKNYEIDMTNGPITGKIIRFSLPLVLQGVLQLLYNAADLIVVGNFGSENSLGGVSATGALINLIVNLFMGLSVGTSVVVASAIGAGNRERASRASHTSVTISLIAGVLLGIFGFFMSRTFLSLMGTPEDVIDLSVTYMKIYFIGMPVNLLFNFGASIMRATGDTRRPMYFLIFSGIINVLLNLLLVIVFKLDIAGVAIATVASQLISAALVMNCLLKTDNCCKIYLNRLRIHKDELLGIIKIGLPAGIQSSIFSASNVIIQSGINSFGSVSVNANAAAASIEGFCYTAMSAIYNAALTFTSQNMGAEKYHRVNQVAIRCLLLCAAVGITLGMSTYIFSEPLIRIYNASPDVVAIGRMRISVISTTSFICGLMDVMVGIIRGMGHSLATMIVTIIGVCGFRIVWIATVFANYQRIDWLYNFVGEYDKLWILYLSYPISWLVTFCIHTLSFTLLRRKYPKEDIAHTAETAAQ